MLAVQDSDTKLFPAVGVRPDGAAGGVMSFAVPESVTVAGLPLALWAMDREAERLPGDPVGVKVTVTVCAAAPALTVNEEGLTVNCAASVPETVIPVTLRAALPVLDTVNVCAPFDPMLTVPNDRDEADWP